MSFNFDELVFESHDRFDSDQARLEFNNDYDVSIGVVDSNLETYSVVVLRKQEGEWELCYDTPVSNDVLGILSKEEVSSIIEKVEAF